MRLHVLLSFTLLSFTFCVHAQNFEIKGSLIDSNDKRPISNATIQLKNVKDTTLRFAASSIQNGSFSFTNIPKGNYRLSIDFLGYKRVKRSLNLQNAINLIPIVLVEDTETLQSVTVEGKIPDVTIKTDTLEFSTKNILIRENSVAEDILKKIPGVEVDKSGAITAQGEKVTKVRVDGKEFFTNDPAMATRNLPADVIDKIQIIDNLSEQSQFSGVDDGDRAKIINITTKPGMGQGSFGQFNASIGDLDRYSVNGNYNRFSKTARLSFLADFNNINKNNFTGEDNSSGGFRRALPNLAGLSNPGIQTVSSFGVNYDSDLDADTKFHIDYSFDNTKLNLIQNSVVQNLSEQNSTTNTININTFNKTTRHRFSSRFENNFDTLTSIRVLTNININQGDLVNNQGYVNIFNSGLRTTTGDQRLTQNNLTPSFSNDILLRHRFKKLGRSISLSMNSDISDGDIGIYNIHNINDVNFVGADSLMNPSMINQFNDQVNRSFSNTLRLVYTEPLAKNLFLEFNAQNRYNNSDVKRYVYDFNINTLQYDQVNDSLTNIYTNKFFTNSGGASINYTNKIINWNIGFAVQHTDLISDNLSRGRRFYQEQINYLPAAMFQYRLNRTKRIRFNYRGSTQQPSVDQIAPIVDNTNALNIRIGNADLRQSFTHNLRLNFNSFNTKSEVMFFSFLGFNATQNAISNRIYIDEQGRTVQQTVNVDGVYGTNGFVSFSFPLVKKALRFTVSAMGSFNKGVSYLRDALNIANNYTLNNGYKLIYTMEKFDATLNGSLILNRATYSAQPISNTRFFTTNAGLDVGYMLPGDLRIASDINYYNNTGRGEGFDRAYVMWNGYLSKQMLKNKQLTVRLSVNDALKNNLGINRTITNFSITDLKYNVLQRYYLLTLTYKLSKFVGSNTSGQRKFGDNGGRESGFRGRIPF